MNKQSAKATVGEPTSQHEIQMFYEQRPSEAWCPSHGLLTMKETVQIVQDRLLGPYFLSPRLTGAIYNDFLRKVLPEPLQDMDMQTRIQLWFMHDNVPPHFLLAV
jgi:hypothetical protein